MIDRHALPVAVPHADAEVLEELQADRAGFDVALELRRRTLAEPRPDPAAEVQVGEADHASRMRAARDGVDAALERRTGAAAQVDEHLEVEGVHLADDLLPARAGETRAVMAVRVDDRECRPRHGVCVDDERRPRRVLLDGHDCRGAARRTLLPGLRDEDGHDHRQGQKRARNDDRTSTHLISARAGPGARGDAPRHARPDRNEGSAAAGP